MSELAWLEDVEDKDFDAAYDYLSLRFDAATASRIVKDMRHAKLERRRANDILRACGRDPLPLDDPGVRRTLTKIMRGKPLSPILVASAHVGGDIADGYHRVSAVYHLDPFESVPLRIG